jgi:hypothetical protein
MAHSNQDVPLTLAHPAVEAHHDVVSIRSWVDRSSYLRDPEGDPVVDEHRESEPELVAVEGALRLADHDRVELSVRLREHLEKAGSFGPAGPREGARLAHVEELGNDLTTGRFDELAGSGELPVA